MKDKIKIKSTTLFRADEEFSDPRYMRVRISVCHSGLNLNHSFISKENLDKAAKDTLKNIPILADVIKKPDGTYDYSGHTMEIIDDAFHEGEQRINYIEKVVGIIPETNEYELVYDKESENYYVECTAFLFRDYGNYAVDILEKRGGQTDVSCELLCNEISYNAKEKYTSLDDFLFTGVTLLGADFQPGMVGANAKTFSEQEENSREDQLLLIMKELTFALNNYNKSNASKGGKGKVTKFEELLTQYKKTIDDITFEFDGLSDEVLEAKFAEAFDNTDNSESEDTEETNVDVEETEEAEETAEVVEAEEAFETEEKVTEIDDAEITSDTFTKVDVYTVDEAGNVKITFDISHEDIRSALYQLVSSYAQSDNDWYFIDRVYDTYFEFVNWDGTKIYKQNYKKDGDNISLDGERIELYQERLTASEKAALDEMRSNYALMVSEEINKKKDEIFNSEKYQVLIDESEFKALRENAVNYTLEEIETKCKLIFADYVLAKGQFSKNVEEVKPHKINFNLEVNKEQIKRPYGNLFDSIKKK